MDYCALTDRLFWPLLRLVLSISVGMFLAGLLESLHWTRFAARIAAPLARAGHLRDEAGASFTLAFFSPAAANALLADAYAAGILTRRELIFANLFNSSPAFLVHLPTMFSMVFAFLGAKAFVYVGLTFAAASARTLCTVIAGRCLLARPAKGDASGACGSSAKKTWRETLTRALTRIRVRLVKVLLVTLPVYCLFFAAQQAGFFALAERWLAAHAGALSFLNPGALGIIVMSLAAESGAAMSAAASLSAGGTAADHEIITALLVGNIAATPMRAFRHQFPSYAGFFSPALALRLVLINQICRAASLVAVTAFYYRASAA